MQWAYNENGKGKMKGKKIIGIAFLTVLLLNVCARFLFAQNMSLEELVDSSYTILVGTVVKKESVKSKSPMTMVDITTSVILSVEEYLKRDIKISEITISYAGGEWEGERLNVETEARFVVGERCLVFLRKDKRKSNVYLVTGGVNGKYTIKNGWVINTSRIFYGVDEISLDQVIARIKEYIR